MMYKNQTELLVRARLKYIFKLDARGRGAFELVFIAEQKTFQNFPLKIQSFKNKFSKYKINEI